jgi:hypothetical protein
MTAIGKRKAAVTAAAALAALALALAGCPSHRIEHPLPGPNGNGNGNGAPAERVELLNLAEHLEDVAVGETSVAVIFADLPLIPAGAAHMTFEVIEHNSRAIRVASDLVYPDNWAGFDIVHRGHATAPGLNFQPGDEVTVRGQLVTAGTHVWLGRGASNTAPGGTNAFDTTAHWVTEGAPFERRHTLTQADITDIQAQTNPAPHNSIRFRVNIGPWEAIITDVIVTRAGAGQGQPDEDCDYDDCECADCDCENGECESGVGDDCGYAGCDCAACDCDNGDCEDSDTPSVTIGTVGGPGIVAGVASGYRTFPVTAANLDGADGTIQFSAAGVVTGLPTGVAASGSIVIADGAGTGTLTLTGDATTTANAPAGALATVTLLGTPSAEFAVIIDTAAGPPPGPVYTLAGDTGMTSAGGGSSWITANGNPDIVVTGGGSSAVTSIAVSGRGANDWVTIDLLTLANIAYFGSDGDFTVTVTGTTTAGSTVRFGLQPNDRWSSTSVTADASTGAFTLVQTITLASGAFQAHASAGAGDNPPAEDVPAAYLRFLSGIAVDFTIATIVIDRVP